MNALSPQIVHVLSIAFAAAAMIVFGRKHQVLEERRPARCAACGRLTGARRGCEQCG